MSEDRARSLSLPYATICGVVERTNAFSTKIPYMSRVSIAMDCESLYRAGRYGTARISALCRHMTTIPVIVMMQLEALGFGKQGRSRESNWRKTP